MAETASCPKCGTSVEVPEPRSFSFNSPYGACRQCDGLGTRLEVDPARVVPDPTKSLEDGAVVTWGDAKGTWTGGTLKALAKTFGFSLKTPWNKLPARTQKLLLYGSEGRKFRVSWENKSGRGHYEVSWEGVIRGSCVASRRRRART